MVVVWGILYLFEPNLKPFLFQIMDKILKDVAVYSGTRKTRRKRTNIVSNSSCPPPWTFHFSPLSLRRFDDNKQRRSSGEEKPRPKLRV